MTDVTLNSALFALVGILFIAISIPLILGKVPPNAIYSFHTVKTLSDPKIWYEANRIAGHDLCIAGIFTMIASLVMIALGQGKDPNQVALILLIVMVLSVTGAALHGIKVVRGI